MILIFGITSLFFLLGISGYVVLEWINGKTLPGWSSLALVSSLGFALTLISLAFIGEYVGRIYLEILKRPSRPPSEL
jgi:dolichol-phosphate mannosyltransferase